MEQSSQELGYPGAEQPSLGQAGLGFSGRAEQPSLSGCVEQQSPQRLRGCTPGATPDSRADSFYSAHSSHPASARSSSQPESVVLGHFLEDLGIEPNEDDEFAWIAEVGIQAELPPGWTSRTDDDSGSCYYVDNDTLASTWEHPLTQHLKRIVEIGRMYLAEPREGLFQEQKVLLWEEHKASLDIWHGPIQDDEGNSYFMNSHTGISSWQDPRLAAAYVYDLQCGLMNHLQTILGAEENGCFVGGTPWETEDGAQVLSLDTLVSSRTPSSMRRSRANLVHVRMGLQTQEDHTMTLQRMSTTADWLQATVQSEEEVQRSRLIQKVEERRMRKLTRKLNRTISDAVQDGEESTLERGVRARSKARGKL